MIGDINNLFYSLISLAVSSKNQLLRTPTDKEWEKLYGIAKKQSLVGVCFVGIQRMCNSETEDYCSIPEMLYLTWMGIAAKLQHKNEVINRKCVELQEQLSVAGFRTCVLKGQGVALSYPDELRMFRQSGDIDIWMDGGFEKINAWVQKVAPTNVINQHHVSLNLFNGTEIEAHYHPINLTNPWRQKILKGFFNANEDECLSDVEDGTIHVPSSEFNLVFLMVHIFHHLFTEGVGLRQLMDYYFVLRNANKVVSNGFNFQNVSDIIHDLRLERFASALMWTLGYVFGLQREEMPWPPCEKDGRFLLNEIMQSGNFGKQDERQHGLYMSKWNSFWMIHMKTFRFYRFDHWAWFWNPIYRIQGYAWRRLHGYRQY